jgi:hypothetical protein
MISIILLIRLKRIKFPNKEKKSGFTTGNFNIIVNQKGTSAGCPLNNNGAKTILFGREDF